MLEQPLSPGRLTRVLLLPATIALLGLLGGCQSPRTGGGAASRRGLAAPPPGDSSA